MICPHCGNDDPEAFDIVSEGYPSDKDYKMVRVCLECNKHFPMV